MSGRLECRKAEGLEGWTAVRTDSMGIENMKTAGVVGQKKHEGYRAHLTRIALSISFVNDGPLCASIGALRLT